MYIDTDAAVMKDPNEEPARLDMEEYLKQIHERAEKERQAQKEMLEKAMGVTHEPVQLTRVDPDKPHCIEALQALKEEKENTMRENAALLKQVLMNDKADTETEMQEAMEKAAQEAAEKVKQEYMKNGLYKQDNINYTAVVKPMYGDYTPAAETKRNDIMRAFLRDIDSHK